MVLEKKLEGRFVNLRSADIQDAAFTRDIRRDPELTKYMPIIKNSIKEQEDWICNQRLKEGDFFFVVEEKSGKAIGTISLYNINGTRGHSGRIAIRGNFIQCIEAQLLMCNFAFNELHLEEITGDCYNDNIRAIKFSEGYGMVFGEPELNEEGILIRFGVASKSNYEKCYKKLSSIIYR